MYIYDTKVNQKQEMFTRRYAHALKGNVFDIASITKLVTATAIFILVSRGKLSLNDEIDEILKIKNFKGIKIRHLLSHVSGLRLSLGSLKEKSKEEMEKIILSAGPTTKPAEAIWYTDQGYYLLGKIGEGLVDKDLINESKMSLP